MVSDGPEVLLMAAWVCWAAAGLRLDQRAQAGSHIVEISGREGHGEQEIGTYLAWIYFLTP